MAFDLSTISTTDPQAQVSGGYDISQLSVSDLNAAYDAATAAGNTALAQQIASRQAANTASTQEFAATHPKKSGNGIGGFLESIAPAAIDAIFALTPGLQEFLPVVAPLVGAGFGELTGGSKGALIGGLEGLVGGQLGGIGPLAPFSSGETSLGGQIVGDVAGGLGISPTAAATGLGALTGAAGSAATGGNPLLGAALGGAGSFAGSEISGLFGAGSSGTPGADTAAQAEAASGGNQISVDSNTGVLFDNSTGQTIDPGIFSGGIVSPNVVIDQVTGAPIDTSTLTPEQLNTLGASAPQGFQTPTQIAANQAGQQTATDAGGGTFLSSGTGDLNIAGGGETSAGLTPEAAGGIAPGAVTSEALPPISATGFQLPTPSQAATATAATPATGLGGLGAGSLDTGGPISDFLSQDQFGTVGQSLYDPSNLGPVPKPGEIPAATDLSAMMGASSITAASELGGGVPLPEEKPSVPSGPSFSDSIASGDVLGALGAGAAAVGGGAASLLGKLPAGALLGGAILGGEALTGGLSPKATPAQTALAGQAAQSQGLANALQAPLLTGQLPQGIQDSIDAATRAAQAAIRSKYADAGLSGSSMEQQDLNSVSMSAATAGYSLAVQMAQLGISDANLSADIYDKIMGVQMSQDQALSNAVVGFATALAGGGKSVTLSLGGSSA